MDRDSSMEPLRRAERRGGAFYDAPGVLERYRAHRQWAENPNSVMEEPAVLEELGSVARLRILDLGCGEADTGRLLLDAGAASYLGVDGSARMADAARAGLSHAKADVVKCDIEEFAAEPASFDLVISRMAFHYVEDIGLVLGRCHDWLAPGGRILFTVVHPVVTSNDARASTDQPREDWVVDNYFVKGARAQSWLGAETRWYHRTVEDYVRALHAAGFSLRSLRECAPSRDRFDDEDEFRRRQRIPLVLLLTADRQ